MKQQPDRRRGTTKAESKAPYTHDGVQNWVEKTLVRAGALKAREIRYERGRDGLTVEFRRGNRVLETAEPEKRYQDAVIPRLEKMGQQGLPRRCRGETGRFLTVLDNREWNTPIFRTRTRTGERMVVRFTSSKPCKGG